MKSKWIYPSINWLREQNEKGWISEEDLDEILSSYSKEHVWTGRDHLGMFEEGA